MDPPRGFKETLQKLDLTLTSLQLLSKRLLEEHKRELAKSDRENNVSKEASSLCSPKSRGSSIIAVEAKDVPKPSVPSGEPPAWASIRSSCYGSLCDDEVAAYAKLSDNASCMSSDGKKLSPCELKGVVPSDTGGYGSHLSSKTSRASKTSRVSPAGKFTVQVSTIVNVGSYGAAAEDPDATDKVGGASGMRRSLPPALRPILNKGPTEELESNAGTEVTELEEHVSERKSDKFDEVFHVHSGWVLDQMQLERSTKRKNTNMEMHKFKKDLLKKQAQEIRGGCDKAEKKTCLPMHPHAGPRLVWDLLAVAFLAYDFVVIPLYAFDLPSTPELYAADILLLAYWTFDMGMSCSTGFYVNGMLRMEKNAIIRNYLQSWFSFDMLVLVPEWLTIIVGIKRGSAGLARTIRGARFLRFVRFVRLLRLVKLEKLLTNFKERVNSSWMLMAIAIARLTLGIIALIHILASAWYFIGQLSPSGWVYTEDIANRSLADRYLYAFQWSMARLHPSSFEKNVTLQSVQERVFAVFVSLVALGGGGYFVSTITNTMAQLQRMRHSHTRKLYVIREFVRNNNISVHLAMRVKAYIIKSNQVNMQAQFSKELAEFLPNSLLTDMRYEAWSPLISVHTFFMRLCTKSPRLMWCLCKDAIVEMPVVSGDIVFTTGDPCEKMFFVAIGEMSYALGRMMGAGARQEEKTLKTGTWLSEPVLWTIWQHQGEFCGNSDSAVLSLDANAFIEVSKAHDYACADIGYYARKFVLALNKENDDMGNCLSDILPPDFYEAQGVPQDAAPRARQSKFEVIAEAIQQKTTLMGLTKGR
eukprot:TRINITY_DN37915_c0_g1_i4.p1 TRINITY_DN37915_c0_g1~~TRINITY_DN37915_c0_g1_i4.p1  ORF type:complete len:813 (-),score=138.56 TRINITY_DN37915_c0_g1_i4:575-3013(-)